MEGVDIALAPLPLRAERIFKRALGLKDYVGQGDNDGAACSAEVHDKLADGTAPTIVDL
jgi:hypothetical protein